MESTEGLNKFIGKGAVIIYTATTIMICVGLILDIFSLSESLKYTLFNNLITIGIIGVSVFLYFIRVIKLPISFTIIIYAILLNMVGDLFINPYGSQLVSYFMRNTLFVIYLITIASLITTKRNGIIITLVYIAYFISFTLLSKDKFLEETILIQLVLLSAYTAAIYFFVNAFEKSIYQQVNYSKQLSVQNELVKQANNLLEERQRKVEEQNNEMVKIKRRLELILTSAGEGIYGQDIEGKVTFINPAAVELLGFKPEELIGKSLHELIHHTKPDGTPYPLEECPILASLRDNRMYTSDNEAFFRKDGSSFPVDFISMPMRNETGEIEGAVITFNDITLRKENEVRLSKQTSELHELITTKDKFFSIIAHDLRSPFNAFIGLTDLLSKDISTYGITDIQRIGGLLNKSAKNLFDLLENLLEWSRMQRGMIAFTPVQLNLNDEVTDVIDSMLGFFVKKEIEIINQVEENLSILGDKYMFVSIIRNLLTNAVKFTCRGGKIHISTRLGADGMVEISIKDTGIGMNEGLQKKLFSLTEKTGRKGTENESSTGLGLLLVKEFVEKHGGKVRVESEEDKGSTFYFTARAMV